MRQVLKILAVIAAVIVGNIITNPTEKLLVEWKEKLLPEKVQDDEEDKDSASDEDVARRAPPLPHRVAKVAFGITGMLTIRNGNNSNLCTTPILDKARRLAVTAFHCVKDLGAGAYKYGAITFAHLSEEHIIKGPQIPARVHSVNIDADIAIIELLYIFQSATIPDAVLANVAIEDPVFAVAAQVLSWVDVEDEKGHQVSRRLFYLDRFRGRVRNRAIIMVDGSKDSADKQESRRVVSGEVLLVTSDDDVQRVSKGFSGGPVFNRNGEIIGMVNASYGGNISAFVSAWAIKQLLEQVPQK